MKKLRVAIIGFGRSGGDIHGAFFAGENNTHYEVVAVVDELDFRRKRAAEQFGCDVFADYHELLDRKDIDLVVNATYSHLHYAVALDFLEHGFSVVTEKPFAVHAEECDRLIEAAERNGVMICPFQQSHFAPYFVKLKEILASGVLGRLIQIQVAFGGYGRRWDWQTVQRFGGGNLRNTGPHPMEQVLDLLDGADGVQVVSRLERANSFGDAEDFVKALLLKPGKPVVDFTINSCNTYVHSVYHIEGTNGTLELSPKMDEIKYRYFRQEEAPEQKLITESLRREDGGPSYCAETLPWHEVVVPIEGTVFEVGTRDYYENIYNHLTAGEELVIQPRRIRDMVALMEQIHRDNPIPVKY